MSLSGTEIVLLTGKLDYEISADTPHLIRQVVEADFNGVLSSPQAKRIFTTSKTPNSNDTSLNQILPLTPGTDTESELELLTVAIACLHAYLQANWTGPPLSPPETFDSATLLSSSLPSSTLDALATCELSFSGEPAYHLSAHPILLRLAQLLLDLPYTHLRSVPWWRLRLYNTHLQVLDDPVPPPTSLLSDLSLIDTSQLPPDLAGTLLLEQGLLHHRLGDDKVAAPFFVQAARATGLNYELTGALGRRTKFQTFDVSQLVLLAESRARPEDEKSEENKNITPTSESTADITTESNAAPETLVLNDDTLLEHTHFTSSAADSSSDTSPLSHIDPNAQPPLHPLDTSILLALCLNVRNTSPSHGLTASQMTPYVSRALAHSKNWSVHTLGLLLRSRLERSRSRTVERSVLQLQALIDQMPSADAPVPQRLAYIHALALPSKWELERELARAFVSLGVIRSALEIFERLEMWEDAVGCYGMLEKREQGIKLVKDLLEGGRTEADVVLVRERQALSKEEKRPGRDVAREAKLWCLLGDLEPPNAKEHYTHAWELSSHTSARAARSIGGLLFNQGEFEEAIPFLKSAVRIAPLWGRTWFVLGCACSRVEDWEGARVAFMRCVAIDDEDAESWNNLASAYLRLAEGGDEDEEKDASVPFANKTMAFRALQHGVRRAHDNWRMWANLAIVSMDVGELATAARAIGRVIEERAARDGAACLDMDILERLVAASCSDPGTDEDGIRGDPNTGSALFRRVLELFEKTILPRISGEPRVFRAYARMLIARSKWVEALQAHTEAYRCSGLAEFKADDYDEKSWEGAATEIGELVEVLRLYGPRAEPDSEPPGRKYIVQARSVLRTFVARSKESFEGSAGWSQLEELGQESKKDLE